MIFELSSWIYGKNDVEAGGVGEHTQVGHAAASAGSYEWRMGMIREVELSGLAVSPASLLFTLQGASVFRETVS